MNMSVLQTKTILLALCLFMAVSMVVFMGASIAEARTVQVFKPATEGVSPMQQRNEALNEGFAKAVMEAAMEMLPVMDEVRSENVRLFFVDRAKPFVQGYKVLSSQAMDAGLILDLDVRVDRAGLRAELERLGLFAAVDGPVEADVVWPENLTEIEAVLLQRLMNLTGVSQQPDVLPQVTLERGPESTYRGTIVLEDGEWSLIGKNLTGVWVDLWARHFKRSVTQHVVATKDVLTVSGWFSPDAALEFDRVLRGWDGAVRDVQLVELDMQTSGVGGVWEVRLVDRARFDAMLNGFLPQRGLSFQLAEGEN